MDSTGNVSTKGAREAAPDPHRGGVPCLSCVTCACGTATSCDEDGCCSGCGGVCVAMAARFGVPHVGVVDVSDADAPIIKELIAEHGRAPRAPADLTDDEIVDAIARRFGQGGFNFDEDDDMAPCWPDLLAEDLGAALGDGGEHQGPVVDAVCRLRDTGRLALVGGGAWFSLSPVEWARCLVGKSEPEIARLLAGDGGSAGPDTKRRGPAEICDQDQPDGYPNPGAGFCGGLAERDG